MLNQIAEKIMFRDHFVKKQVHQTWIAETEHYGVKNATSLKEKLQIFSLRHEVFFQEKNLSHSRGLDFEKYDLWFDHLTIIEKSTNQCVGTYRLRLVPEGGQFYSESEFELSKIKNLPGKKLELGRACVDKNHRNGTVLNLLWKGIASHIRTLKPDYLIGCSSISSLDPSYLLAYDAKLKSEGFYSDLTTEVLPPFRFTESELANAPTLETIVNVSDCALLNLYLKIGAKICGGPALDRKMGCADYLTLVKMSDVKELVKKRYSL